MALDRTELTAVAQKYYDAELARRELTVPLGDEGLVGPDGAGPDGGAENSPGEFSAGEETDWLSDAACACSFSTRPGQFSADADNAREVLEAAGIPCRIDVHEVDPLRDEPPPYQEYRVMVPGALNLRATSVLDKELFNAGLESEWRAHFAALSDEELRVLNPDVICAGLKDRIERLTRAYNDEIAGRRQKLH